MGVPSHSPTMPGWSSVSTQNSSRPELLQPAMDELEHLGQPLSGQVVEGVEGGYGGEGPGRVVQLEDVADGELAGRHVGPGQLDLAGRGIDPGQAVPLRDAGSGRHPVAATEVKYVCPLGYLAQQLVEPPQPRPGHVALQRSVAIGNGVVSPCHRCCGCSVMATPFRPGPLTGSRHLS